MLVWQGRRLTATPIADQMRLSPVLDSLTRCRLIVNNSSFRCRTFGTKLTSN